MNILKKINQKFVDIIPIFTDEDIFLSEFDVEGSLPLFVDLGYSAASINAAGIVHGDLHLSNCLARPERMQIIFVDIDSAEFGSPDPFFVLPDVVVPYALYGPSEFRAYLVGYVKGAYAEIEPKHPSFVERLLVLLGGKVKSFPISKDPLPIISDVSSIVSISSRSRKLLIANGCDIFFSELTKTEWEETRFFLELLKSGGVKIEHAFNASRVTSETQCPMGLLADELSSARHRLKKQKELDLDGAIIQAILRVGAQVKDTDLTYYDKVIHGLIAASALFSRTQPACEKWLQLSCRYMVIADLIFRRTLLVSKLDARNREKMHTYLRVKKGVIDWYYDAVSHSLRMAAGKMSIFKFSALVNDALTDAALFQNCSESWEKPLVSSKGVFGQASAGDKITFRC